MTAFVQITPYWNGPQGGLCFIICVCLVSKEQKCISHVLEVGSSDKADSVSLQPSSGAMLCSALPGGSHMSVLGIFYKNSSFPVARKATQGRKFTLAHRLRVQFIMAETSRQQKLQTAGHMASTVRRQWGLCVCTYVCMRVQVCAWVHAGVWARVCRSAHVCSGVCTCTCVWRPEVNLRCCPSGGTLLVF